MTTKISDKEYLLLYGKARSLKYIPESKDKPHKTSIKEQFEKANMELMEARIVKFPFLKGEENYIKTKPHYMT